MAIDIIVPRLGWSMEQGAFVAWLKRDGEQVQAGEPLFTIEGDKAVQEVEAIGSGVLRLSPRGPKAGDTIRVGDVLGQMLSREEAAGRTRPAAAKKSSGDAPVAPAKSPAAPAPVAAAPVTAVVSRPVVAVPASAGALPSISPRAVRVAAELGVNWSTVRGTGRTGRIRERDIRLAASARGGGAATVSALTTSRAVSPAVAGGLPGAVFFGEILMRLETLRHERFVQARELGVRYTGAEANAAVTLAGFGLPAWVVSRVPDHDVGQACVNYLRQYGVNTEHVVRGGDRLGTLFLETGAPPRASQVIYDRAGSAFAALKPRDLDWDAIFAGKRWFHWTGTVPALSPGLPAVVAEACAAARRHGVRISCDLNYRSKLWTPDVARQVMLPLVRDVDVLIGNEEHIGLVLGVKAPVADPPAPATERCAAVAQRLRELFRFERVAITVRDGTALDPTFQGMLVDDAGVFASRVHPVSSVDRIGAGDAFTGALIYSLLSGQPGGEAIEFAAAAGCLKHSVPGDFNLVSRDEVLAVARGETGERVRR